MQKPDPLAPRGERRCGRDRRRAEAGPPGVAERRRAVEPRLPETVELEMSMSQWQSLADGAPADPAQRADGDLPGPAPRPPRGRS